MIGKIKNFFYEVVTELKKVSWSTRQELLGATWVILGMTAMLTIFVGSADFVLSKFLRLIIQ